MPIAPAHTARVPRIAVSLALVLVAALLPSAARADVPPGRIAFESARDGNSEAYTMAADGTDVRRLTDHPAGDHAPTWSPDGSRLVFHSTRDGDAEIFVMNPDGTGLKQLTFNSAFDGFAMWSARDQIAFVTLRNGGADVYVMNADGKSQRNATPNSGFDGFPAWSPDGSRLYFASARGYPGSNLLTTNSIYSANPDGSDVRRITELGIEDHAPAISPDGTRMAFTSTRDSVFGEIYVMDLASGAVTRITTDLEANDFPSWSPDGEWLAYMTTRDGATETDPLGLLAQGDIAVIRADGTGEANLTRTPAVFDSYPWWSPV